MARQTINITNGKGSIELVNGTYNATAVVGGYDSSTLTPNSVNVVEGTNTYSFTISATGTLTLHVTDTGDTGTGVDIVGAKFIRIDSTGTVVGTEVVTNKDGNAVFNNVSFTATGSNPIYYKQTAGDGGHTFDDGVKSIIMTLENKTVEITNPQVPLRNFTWMDEGYPIIDGQIILQDN